MFKKVLYPIKNKNLRIRLFPFLILGYLWTYGYMGAFTRTDPILQISISLILVLIVVILFYSYKKLLSKDPDIDLIILNFNDLKIYFFILSISLIVGFNFMLRSLIGDELSHSGLAQLHSIQGLLLVYDYLPTFIKEQNIRYLIWYISALVLIVSILFIYIIYKWDNKYNFLLLSILILLFFRFLLFYVGGRDPYHPPFRLFPLWISSSFFSPTNFSFRLPGLMALSFIGLIIYKSLKLYTKSPILLCLCISTILTIPTLWNISLITDSSIWASLFAILFLLAYQSNQFHKFNFFVWFSLLSIFICMRQSLIFLIIPFIFIYIFDKKKKLLINWKETFYDFSPFLISAPFLFRTFFFGNPATVNLDSEYQWSFFEQLNYALTSDILIDTILKNFEIWWIFLFFVFFPFKKHFKSYYIIIFLFILCSFIVFYSIRPILWGHPKYLIEYVVPLIILGKISFLSFLLRIESQKINFISLLFLSGLLFFNLYTIFISHKHNSSLVNNHSIISSHPIIDYKNAFRVTKEYGYSGNAIILGNTYGVMNEILYNYTLTETKQHFDLQKKYDSKKDLNLESLYQDNRVKIILISDLLSFGRGTILNIEKRQFIYDELLKNGFKEWKSFSKENTTYDIISLVRIDQDEK